MGKKRKHSERSDEKQLKKVEKLLKRLKRRRRKSSSSSSTSEEEMHQERSYQERSDVQTESTPIDLTVQPDVQPSIEITSDHGENSLFVIEDEILTLLGDAPKDECPVGPDIHSDIASRLNDILLNGLKKEAIVKISEEYPVPGNCQLFKAPVLNAEIKAAVSENLIKKDSSLVARQHHIAIALTALVRAMDMLIKEKDLQNQNILKHVTNASRLLCDSHSIDTRVRRNFLISTLDNKIKETLREKKRDKYLFGEDLHERLKSSKAISKTSQDLKIVQKVTTKNTKTNNYHLNWKYPQPKPAHNKKHVPAYRTAGLRETDIHHSEPARKNRGTATRARASAQYKHNRRN